MLPRNGSPLDILPYHRLLIVLGARVDLAPGGNVLVVDFFSDGASVLAFYV